ncbi:MAG: SDR family NAD(P)-dependent oxidoreductase [Actinobacteria bacterium]|nr:SDR family NAD(P)-dependent oxidoreductase [Actinomycetota bacterium]
MDTVKQAEVFAGVREHFGVERDAALQLRDFPTLAHVVGWVRSKTGIAAPTVEPVAEPVTGPVAEPVAAQVTEPAGDPVLHAVVGIVAEMTGYPPELLDADLDLEADLGVDPVKQAEVFAQVRVHFGVERDAALQLRDFPTLAHVVGWVRSKTGIAAPGAGPVAGQPVPAAEEPVHPAPQEQLRGDLAAIDALPRRVPVPVVRPTASACARTGVTLGAGTRVVLAPDTGGVAAALAKRLDRLGVTVLTLDPASTVDEVTATLDGWLADGPVHGVYWLPALDDEGPLDALDLAGWREALRRRVKTLHATMRRLFDGAPFLVTATRLGGFHGYDDAGATCPLGGAVTGFAKSYKKEQPAALVKAVDLPPADRRTAAPADALVEETLVDPGCVEVGRPAGAQRWGVGLAVRPFPALHDGSADGDGGLVLDGGSTVVVTGAAGSIVSAITADLAAASGARFHLLDLTPAPDPADPDLQRYLTDREGLKADLAARMKDRGERPTPVAIDKELARFERLAAALAAIRAVEAAGGTARYHSVDLTDAAAVAAVVADVRASSERVDLLLHAAGLEISRGLPAKEPREFDLVLDVKCDGWFCLVHALGDTPVGATVVFSSVAGRFGNAGQTDYTAANDLLCKVTSSLRRTRPGTRAIALDWTAWGGIGMATRGSIPTIMAAAGVEMLPPEAGIAWIRRELVSSGFRGEVVVAGRLGLMAAENDPAGGLDVGAVDVAGCGPMVGAVAGVRTTDGLVVTTTLDPAAQPFLDHHRIDGVPVLPGVMGMEAFVEAARLAARLGGVPHEVTGLEDVAFLAPVKFYRDEPRTVTVTALLRADAGGDLIADCRLEAQRVLPGAADPVTTVHFTGRVRLSTAVAPAAPDLVVDLTEPAADAALGPDAVYRLYFHGPAYQVVGGAWRTGDGATARLADPLPEDHVPAAAPLASAPRLVELCFQAAGLWEAGRQDRLALPRAVARVRWVAGPPPSPGDGANGALFAVATPEAADGVFDCAVVDAQGHVVLALDGYATVPLPAPLPDDVSAPLRGVFAG